MEEEEGSGGVPLCTPGEEGMARDIGGWESERDLAGICGTAAWPCCVRWRDKAFASPFL